jgi:hypothetical protein
LTDPDLNILKSARRRKEKEKAGSIRGGTRSGGQSSQQNHRIKIRFLINNFFATRMVFTTFLSTFFNGILGFILPVFHLIALAGFDLVTFLLEP